MPFTCISNKDSSLFQGPEQESGHREEKGGGGRRVGSAGGGVEENWGEIVQGRRARERENPYQTPNSLGSEAPDTLARLSGWLCVRACVCVCSSVRSPHPQHAFASCDYLIVSHYPPPPTPLAFPKQKAFPGPPFQPRSRRDSLGLGPGPRPAAEELRTVHGHHRGPGSICPPHIPAPLPQHPPLETREGLWS